jgi:hypothetical protein
MIHKANVPKVNAFIFHWFPSDTLAVRSWIGVGGLNNQVMPAFIQQQDITKSNGLRVNDFFGQCR